MSEQTLVNGQPGAGISSLDRGLQYGDGLFETIAVRGARPRLMPYHLERLAEGCARLAIPVPDTATLAAEIEAVMAGRDGVVKVIVTRP